MLSFDLEGAVIALERVAGEIAVSSAGRLVATLPLGEQAGVSLGRNLWLLCDRAPAGTARVRGSGVEHAESWDEKGLVVWVAVVRESADPWELVFEDSTGRDNGRMSGSPVPGRALNWRQRLLSRLPRRRARAISLKLPGDS